MFDLSRKTFLSRHKKGRRERKKSESGNSDKIKKNLSKSQGQDASMGEIEIFTLSALLN
jgi:hypothetical protein